MERAERRATNALRPFRLERDVPGAAPGRVLVQAAVDMNVVMTGLGRFVEVQGSGEEATFDQEQLLEMIALARAGIAELGARQFEALGKSWPMP